MVWMDECRTESKRPLVGPGTVGGALFVGVFIRDPSPPVFTRVSEKTTETPNGHVDKRDRGMNLVPPVNHFLSAATGGAKNGQFGIHALPAIQTRDLSCSSQLS